MLPCGFKREFDSELIEALYRALSEHDSGITLVLRKKSGKKVDSAYQASIGEIKNSQGKALFAMGPKEGLSTSIKLES